MVDVKTAQKLKDVIVTENFKKEKKEEETLSINNNRRQEVFHLLV